MFLKYQRKYTFLRIGTRHGCIAKAQDRPGGGGGAVFAMAHSQHRRPCRSRAHAISVKRYVVIDPAWHTAIIKICYAYYF